MKKSLIIIFTISLFLPLFAGTMTISKIDGTEITVEVSEIKNIHFSGEKVAYMQMMAMPLHLDWTVAGDNSSRNSEIRVVLRDGNNDPVVNKEIVFSGSLGEIEGDNYFALSDENGEVSINWIFEKHQCFGPTPGGPGFNNSTIKAQVVGEKRSSVRSIYLRRYTD